MTTNQIALQKLEEERRANLAKEQLTSQQLLEVERHNKKAEQIQVARDVIDGLTGILNWATGTASKFSGYGN